MPMLMWMYASGWPQFHPSAYLPPLGSPWSPWVQLPCNAAADRLGRSQRFLGAYVMITLRLRDRLPLLGSHNFYTNSDFTGKTLPGASYQTFLLGTAE